MFSAWHQFEAGCLLILELTSLPVFSSSTGVDCAFDIIRLAAGSFSLCTTICTGQDVHESTGVASSFLADIPISRQRNPSQLKRPQGTLSKPSFFPERGPPPSTLKTTTTSPQRVDTCAAKL
ncbi:hypothetical protein QC761_0079590 [Podospora bellae-mahoneyi]|uniref:Secreted protein n=1 Tax=Podospora bellae-mahoneyi TaxID=2093777 RepID=A0ABR0FGU1_9PEZI|nr:hypothetical protein QC761_0079590 [Podospora bellae-mahoneyi]